MSGSLQLAVFGRIGYAAALGFVIGLERELRGSPAGERTIALVAAGAAAFSSIAVEIFPQTGGLILAGVATGIGFLGAGLIWRMGAGPARGLTTAAATWTVAAMGLLAGARLYLAAGLVALLTLLILEFEYFPFLGRLVHRTSPPLGPDDHRASEPGA